MTGLRLTLAAAMALLVCGAMGCDQPAAVPEAAVWRFAIEETAGSVQDAYAQRFRELVEARSHGEVRVIVYPYGALGTSDHITEQLHNGTLELAMSSPGHLGKLIPEMQAFLLHFVLDEDGRVNAEALRDPELRAFLNELYEEKDLAFLAAFGEGPMVWTTRRDVRRPEDFTGLRMRVMTSPLLVASYEAYGGSPTPLPYSEVYSGLQLGMIDGQDNPVFAIEEMSFYEVTDWMIFARHAEFVTTLAANPAFLDGLTPARRRMLEEIVDELELEIFEIQRELNGDRLARILERRPDLQVVHLTAEEQARFRARAARVHALYVERTGPRGARLLRLIEAALARHRGAAPASETPATE